MSSHHTSRQPRALHLTCAPLRAVLCAEPGGSLIEFALVLPFLLLLVAYVVDFGYFFIASAIMTSAARDAAQYSVLGYQSPGQLSLPLPGPVTSASSVAAEAYADIAGLANSGATATVQVCTQANGTMLGVANCTSYGPSATAYTPAADPEAPVFILQRVDITYTVHPPIALSFFNTNLLPTMQFHRQVSMRALN